MSTPLLQAKQTTEVSNPDGTGAVAITVQTDLTREAISSSPNLWWGAMARTLPRYIDENTRRFGADVYEHEMMLDPQVASVVDILRLGATSEGTRLAMPENTPEEDKEQAQEIIDFVQEVFDNLRTPYTELLYELTGGIITGHKVAELVWEVRVMKGVTRLVIADARPKPNKAVRFVVDDKNNLIGYLPVQPGLPAFDMQTFISDGVTGQVDGALADNLLVPEKCLNFVWDPENNDPRGRSSLRVAYTEWFMKVQLKPEYLAFLHTQAIPSMWGTTPEGAQTVPEYDPVTGVPTGRMLDARAAMRAALEDLSNGAVAVGPFGSTASYLQVQSKGEAFTQAFGWLDRQIAKGVTKQTLATEQGEHQARAAAQTHQDILALPVHQISDTLCRTIREGMVKPLVLFNFGESLMRLCPEVVRATVEQQDFARIATAIAALYKAGYIHESQLEGLDDMLDLPQRDMEAMVQDKAAQDALQKQRAATAASILNLPQPGPQGAAQGPPADPLQPAPAPTTKAA